MPPPFPHENVTLRFRSHAARQVLAQLVDEEAWKTTILVLSFFGSDSSKFPPRSMSARRTWIRPASRSTSRRWRPHYSPTGVWPDILSDRQIQSASMAKVVEVYPNRGVLPPSLWLSLLAESVESVDVLAFAATFMHDTLADFSEIITDRAARGVRVRFLLGDPASEAVKLRGAEEGIGDLLAQRCRLTWIYLRPLLDLPGVEARQHGSTLYASLFRFDREVFVNHHLFGSPANHSSVTRIGRVEGGRLFDHAMASYERVWGRRATGAGERSSVALANGTDRLYRRPQCTESEFRGAIGRRDRAGRARPNPVDPQDG